MRVGLVRSTAAAAVVAGLLVVSAANAERQRDPLSGSAADRAQILAILSQWEDAWNSHDMSAFASVFHDDGVWILWTGDVWKGKRVIEEGHAAVHRTVWKVSWGQNTRLRREVADGECFTKLRERVH